MRWFKLDLERTCVVAFFSAALMHVDVTADLRVTRASASDRTSLLEGLHRWNWVFHGAGSSFRWQIQKICAPNLWWLAGESAGFLGHPLNLSTLRQATN